MPTILVIEDEEDVVDLIRYNLRKAGHDVFSASTGDEGLEMVSRLRPSAILLDLMLPGKDGFEVCRAIRETPDIAHTGIIMLTAKGEVDARVRGLESGPDDYLTKPFSPKELVLRLQALLRRLEQKEKLPTETIGAFEIDRSTLEVYAEGEKLDLSALEFKLLVYLLDRANRVQSREKLLAEVWGYKNFVDTRTVDTHIRRLRTALGAHGDCLETIRGEGYCIAIK